MSLADLPQWLDKVESGGTGVLTLDDGKQMTVGVVEFDDDRRELVVEVIPPNHSQSNGERGHRSISIDHVVSFEPQSPEARPWPYSDPCPCGPFSFARFALMSTMFLSWTFGSIPLFLLLIKKPYGLQEASAISYTLFVVWLTFAATRKWRRFKFTCPAVEPEIPRLLFRHLGFLVALFALQAAALAVRPHLPDWWNIEDAKGETPFVPAFMFLCMGLAFAQVLTNRSLLERAHREFSE